MLWNVLKFSLGSSFYFFICRSYGELFITKELHAKLKTNFPAETTGPIFFITIYDDPPTMELLIFWIFDDQALKIRAPFSWLSFSSCEKRLNAGSYDDHSFKKVQGNSLVLLKFEISSFLSKRNAKRYQLVALKTTP